MEQSAPCSFVTTPNSRLAETETSRLAVATTSRCEPTTERCFTPGCRCRRLRRQALLPAKGDVLHSFPAPTPHRPLSKMTRRSHRIENPSHPRTIYLSTFSQIRA